MKVVIAGAGIGGLTSALCCLQRGMDVHIIEKAPALTEIGAGIQISPNAMRVFQKLDLAEAVIEKGFLPEKLETRMGQSGRRLFAIDAQSWDAPYVHIHRADLIHILANRIRRRSPNSLDLGQAVTGLSQAHDHVQVILESGETAKGDYLIGADGIHSTIRSVLFGTGKPRFTGNMAWRAVVSTDQLGALAPEPNATIWMGHKRHAVTYRLRGGSLTNFVGVVETSGEMDESWTHKGAMADLKADFQNWHPTISTLIENVEPDNLYKWALYDRSPLPRWCQDRVVIIGDAAHPMLPFMAQGAAQAIEDSYVLADVLAAMADNPARLKDTFEFDRIDRVNEVQSVASGNMKTFHRAGGLGKLSYLPMWLGGRLAKGLIKKRVDWIYDDDVTAL